MKKYKCVVTGQEYEERYLTRTSDGFRVLFHIYMNCSHELKKGILSSKDILTVVALYDRYYIKVLELIKYIRKSSVYTKIDVLSVISDLEEREQEIAVTKFNKYRNCLEVSEHLIILEELINYLKLDDLDRITLSFCSGWVKGIVHDRLMKHKERVYGSVKHLHDDIAKDI